MGKTNPSPLAMSIIAPVNVKGALRQVLTRSRPCRAAASAPALDAALRLQAHRVPRPG